MFNLGLSENSVDRIRDWYRVLDWEWEVSCSCAKMESVRFENVQMQGMKSNSIFCDQVVSEKS